ncbi:acyl-CoA-binding domain-containing protein 3-like protein [Carex littledalei]|uniref:Acyl-CoA-binding domain-containing protein 3-like protein n=1 Tax=Carex littledalei TaxID=544730 RepID=A0A833VBC2_9POAL|nr:acyl-CoA-binding domain-containing protein 3-like protein [Carex littledalei]
MDFFNELYLSAVISIILAFLLGKFGSADNRRRINSPMASSRDSSIHVAVEPNPTSYPVKDGEEEIEQEEEEEKAENEVEIERFGGLEEEGWEGVERSGIEGLFSEAVKFTGGDVGKEKVGKLAREMQLRLHGLYKVATEGPCYQPQPMAIKLTSRSRWNAWQKLGDMNPTVAMERYVTLLQECIPDWNEGISKVDTTDSDSNSFLAERSSANSSPPNIDQVAAEQTVSKQGLTPTVVLNLLCPTRMAFLTFYI